MIFWNFKELKIVTSDKVDKTPFQIIISNFKRVFKSIHLMKDKTVDKIFKNDLPSLINNKFEPL